MLIVIKSLKTTTCLIIMYNGITYHILQLAKIHSEVCKCYLVLYIVNKYEQAMQETDYAIVEKVLYRQSMVQIGPLHKNIEVS